MALIKLFFKATYESLKDSIAHDGVEHAGYLAFLAILSFFPFLVFLLASAKFLGDSSIGTHFLNTILDNHLFPKEVMSGLKPRILEILSGPPPQLMTLSICGAIWTASSMLEGLRTILNRAYRVNTPPTYILRRILSIIQLILITAAITIVTFLFIAIPPILSKADLLFPPYIISQLQQIFGTELSIGNTKIFIFRYFASGLAMFIMVTLSYLIIPNIKHSIINTAPGALYAIILWNISGILFAQYLSHFKQVSLIYGSLAGIIAALIFFYINAVIYVFGAEFNYHFSRARGNLIEAKIIDKPSNA